MKITERLEIVFDLSLIFFDEPIRCKLVMGLGRKIESGREMGF